MHGHVAPPEHRQLLLGDDPLDHRLRLLSGDGVGGQKGVADGVATAFGQLEPGIGDDVAQEAVGYLQQDARAVAGVGLRTRGAAMLHVPERGQPVDDELVAGDALDVRDERDTTGVVLETRIVEISPSVGRGHGPLPQKSGSAWVEGPGRR